jgi:hypothetical protein
VGFGWSEVKWMANAFQLGDVVVLKSGGPPMTVDAVPGTAGAGVPVHLVQGRLAGGWVLPRASAQGLYASAKMTPEQAAAWMLREYEAKRFLYQDEAASHLLHLNDENLAYFDANGNVCVGKKVLAAFNKLTPDIVYERTDKFWRDRLSTDQPGRQQ